MSRFKPPRRALSINVFCKPPTHFILLFLVDGRILLLPPFDNPPSDHVLVLPLNCYRTWDSHRCLVTSSMPWFKPPKRALSIHVSPNPPTYLNPLLLVDGCISLSSPFEPRSYVLFLSSPAKFVSNNENEAEVPNFLKSTVYSIATLNRL